MLLVTRLSRKILEISYVRLALLIVAGVFMGYTLLPVPPVLERLFNSSNAFKFIVLYVCGLGLLPSDVEDRHVITLALVCLVALLSFQTLRRIK